MPRGTVTVVTAGCVSEEPGPSPASRPLPGLALRPWLLALGAPASQGRALHKGPLKSHCAWVLGTQWRRTLPLPEAHTSVGRDGEMSWQ